MIWVRRGFAAFLIILFVVLFIVSLVLAQVDSKFSDPDFYNKQMHEADVYHFVHDGALPAGLDEIEEENEPEDIPVHLTKVKEETISAAREIVPPEWLQSQFEMATEAFLPYFLGETDQFTYTFYLKERALAASRVLRDDFLQGETFESIYSDGMSFLAEKIVENLDQLPYDILLTKEQIEGAITTIIPADWIIRQVGPAIDSATPYFTGDSDHFTVTLRIADRVDIAATEIINLFSGEETYQYLMDELIVPMVEENLGQVVDLPFGVSLVREEVISAIKQVLPREWITERLEEVVYGIADYVKGETQTFAVTIDMENRKAVALDVLTGIADQRLSDLFNSLPVCSRAEFEQAVRDIPSGRISDCRPSGISYEEFKAELKISISSAIKEYIGDKIQDQWTYTEADLRNTMGAENQDYLDKAREWFEIGWTYTDADLRADLDPDENDTLDDIRDWIANGYTLTEQDLRDEMDEDELDTLDDSRDLIDTFRSWLWVMGLIPFLLIIAIGFLGGRGWKGRVYWAFATLFITSLVIYIALTVACSSVGEPEIEDAFDLESETGLELVMLEKGQEVALNVLDSFASGMKTDVLWIVIFSGLILGGTVAWRFTRVLSR